jgi:molybdopterin molybdotransferase
VSPPRLSPDAGCAGPEGPGILRVAEARERILADLGAVEGTEQLAVRSALHRVLDEEVVSPVDVPPHTNAAMDGFAVRGADLPEEGSRSFAVVGTAWAGRPCTEPVGPGQAARVMTGAKMPAGADTVIMQEQAEAGGDGVRLGPGHRVGENVREAGEDLRRGAVVLEPGKLLGPAELGLLASLGRSEVRVRRRPRVAFFSTGDELRSVGQPLEEGQIYDSNRYTLYGMLRSLGVELADMGVVPDRPEALREALALAGRTADLLITSGGVSVGAADHVKDVLSEVGEIGFWKIAMKPGRPLAYGRVGGARFFGLPGNPVAVMVTFHQFVRPGLRKLMGLSPPFTAPSFRVPCRSGLRRRPGRTEFQRGRLSREPDGTLVVDTTGAQGSGILRSMSEADCLIILPEEGGAVEPGTPVEIQLLSGGP